MNEDRKAFLEHRRRDINHKLDLAADVMQKLCKELRKVEDELDQIAIAETGTKPRKRRKS